MTVVDMRLGYRVAGVKTPAFIERPRHAARLAQSSLALRG